MSHFPTTRAGIFDDGTSYTDFYSLPQWTHHTLRQPSPIHQEQYSPCALVPSNYPQQYPYIYTDVPFGRLGQLQPPIIHNVPDQPIRRKRASRPKVRTGCTTCKIRRVKCDEAKPSCLRCTSTGRKCDGYQYEHHLTCKAPSQDQVTPPPLPPLESTDAVKRDLLVAPSPSPSPSPSPLPSPLLLSSSSLHPRLHRAFKGTIQERRSFHRFTYRTVPAFAGGSESEFWTVLVLRTAVSEPVIRDAVIALSTLHEDYENRGGAYDQHVCTSTSYKDAALLYVKAIKALYQRIDTGAGEEGNLAVIASILFACFEVLRRNNMAALVHYQNGMRALMKQMNERDRPAIDNGFVPSDGSTVLRSRPQDDMDRMLRVFARYDVQACTYYKQRAEVLSVDLSAVPPNEVGLTEVRHYLDNLLIAVYQLVKSDLSMFRYWKRSEVPVDWVEKRDQALETFQGWLDVLDKSIPSDAVTLRNHGILASKSILGLVLQIKIAMIMLRTCIDCGPEATFDQFNPDFEEIVSRVENLTRLLDLKEGKPLDRETVPFSMELGVIHPLFFVALKCRDRQLRRRAVVQLRKCGKEGAWEGPIMAVVVKKIIQIEEEGLPSGAYVPEGARIHDVRKTVVYDERVVMVEFKLAQDSTWKNWKSIRQRIPF